MLTSIERIDMYKATLTFKDSWSEYVRTVEHDQQDMFYAILAGTIQGNINAGSALIGMERC
jgi:hypothetical protein